MKAEVWLKIQGKQKWNRWEAGTISASKMKPSTNSKEIAVKVTLEVPDEVFEEPVYEAKVSLPKVNRKFPDLQEVGDQVKTALEKSMGFKVKLEMADPDAKTEDV